MKKKRTLFFAVLAMVLLVGIVWMIWGNTTVALNTITVAEGNLPDAFDGFRIAHVSDLHNSDLWEKVIVRLKQAQPDVICITGDIVDSRRTNVEKALRFAAEAAEIAPCYYVTGNHESRLSDEDFTQLISGLTACGITVLSDETVLLEWDGAQICLVGHRWGQTDAIGELKDFAGYNILLSHHPEAFDDYMAADYDLVLSGHAHGGQFRLPFIGGLYAPGQGILPQYDSGLYSERSTDMVVSRGIGNSGFPIRFNNRPEVILILLKSA